ncbi:hypothetical protein HMPREF1544_06279 [Mucor circinelloides 1006PhL]|uniref:PH domain-containing protein n=1 Tax=Mucor circinelloides f. circinelloides (strain 1006PhL) TaxID=1220926 RepID=S2JA03_MUCC1|nr:hypothetical protein HMPREF1544_06279 [Mucor circinelloides 1006PhL]
MDFPLTIDDKEVFRLSIASQSSTTTTSASTSSQRLSVASSSNEDDAQVAYCPPNSLATTSSLSPSSRYLLSGYSTSENLRNRVLSRFYPSSTSSTSSSSRHQKSLSDPFIATTVMPSLSSLDLGTESITNHVDPWCMSVRLAADTCIVSDWLYKYEQPTFAFSRSWKRRLFILVDRIVYNFKSSKSTTPAKEHFVLTDDTFVFVTEEFKKGFIIELRKPLCKWYIRCESVNQMRCWLEAMKKIVACIKIGYDGLLNNSILASVKLTDDYRILIPSKVAAIQLDRKQHYRQSLPVSMTFNNNNKDILHNRKRPHSSSSATITKSRQSLAEIPDWESILPPQLPPPKSRPPPVPSAYTSNNNNNNLPTVSE